MVFLNIARNTIQPIRYAKQLKTVNLCIIRTYARWNSRRPIAIVNEDELFESEDTTQPQIRRERISARKSSKKKPTQEKKSEKTENAAKKNLFTKLKENEKIVSSLMSNLKSRKRREKNDEIVLEGKRLIIDAIKSGAIPHSIIFNDSSDIAALKLPNEVKLYKVPYTTIQLWSALTTSPGLLGIFKTPNVHKNEPADNALPLTIVCDNIREPGNLGSIMRAAAAVGCEKLILMKGCVDLWDPKVLRSAAGTHFQLPIHAFPTWDEIPLLISEDSNIFVADSTFGDEFLHNYSTEILQTSLQIFDIDPEDLKSKLTVDTNKQSKEDMVPKNKHLMRDFMLKLPILPYYSVDYTKKESVIVVSGETEGLNFNSYKFLKEKNGIRINIPLVKGVDSLNAAVALGVVIFEIRRQFFKKKSLL
ncbi:rRNA methyltransferase 3, mitochondrial [Bombus vancouverensis nearcticus]|uniref:rRNA methyltransferase 3, mitochondrial n=1 Tax=Bombus bifarius TaxID=103933 RepID=A0A6P8P3D8_9HYME|nr:rRNA methyltransferase 3, mitochondrial [Bombus vancouverensis nearcticus]XP_033320597.1 rRNA methyltransferase 3, mitochondrial [Bombus bifarius]